MISLNKYEKIILQQHSNLVNGFSIKNGNLFLTNERLIYEDKKIFSNSIYIKIDEIKSYKELRVLLKFTGGINIILESGINYSFSLGYSFKSFLLKLEDVKGNPIKQEQGIQHFWFPNLMSFFLLLFLIVWGFSQTWVSPVFSDVNSSKIKESCDLKYDRNKNQYIILYDHIRKNSFCETYTIFMDYEDDYGNLVWKPYSTVSGLTKENYNEIKKYEYYSRRVPMSNIKFYVIK